jgi:hypothetical protein
MAAQVPARLARPAGEAEARDRRRHHVEGVAGVAAMRPRVGERADDLGELDDRARPTVVDDQGQGVGLGRTRVHEVQVQSVDRGGELGELVQARLVRPPVVGGEPVLDQLPQVGERDAVLPAGGGQLLRPAGEGQAVAQVVELGLRDLDPQGPDVPAGAVCVGCRRGFGVRIRGHLRCTNGIRSLTPSGRFIG